VKKCLACESRFLGQSWRCPTCGSQPEAKEGHLTFAPDLAERNDGFSATYFECLASNEAGHYWFESRNRILLWALNKYFPRMKSFLEIGCGTGFVLTGIGQRFPRVRLSGSEIFRDGLAFAAKRLPTAELFQMDARRIPFVDEFDVAGAFDVLEHIEEDEAVLRQMHDAVKPGGGIILTVPQHPALWSGVDEYSCHKRRYTRSELTRKVRKAGFIPIHTTSFVTLLLPAMAILRYQKRRYTEDFDPDAGFTVRPIVNKVLTGVQSVERQLIQMGLSLPAGGSLLMAARRE